MLEQRAREHVSYAATGSCIKQNAFTSDLDYVNDEIGGMPSYFICNTPVEGIKLQAFKMTAWQTIKVNHSY